jgi:glycosyltransferase involved in cell wall biosynthesis
MSAGENPKGMRLAVVLSHPTQYYSPWFRWLATHSRIELRVFYLWDFGVTRRRDPQFGTTFEWDVDLLSGYDSEFVPNTSRNPGAERFLGFDNPELTARIAAWGPGALLMFGYKWASHLRAIAWARLHRVPLLFRGDSHLIGRGAPSLPARLALRALYSQFAGFLCVGSANRGYFKAFGVPDRKLFVAPHSVNDSLFDPSHAPHAEGARRLRAELGLAPDARVVLFAGKFVPAKQPMELLSAFMDLARPASALVFVGAGPEREALQAAAARAGKAADIRFLPFANQSEMPARYLLADVFALPSRGVYETWGLAVNEAMHMGVPCLVSDRVGCQRDLVTEGVTGWVFASEDPQSLRAALARALDDVAGAGRRQEVRAAVSARIAGFTYERTTEGLLAALASLPG